MTWKTLQGGSFNSASVKRLSAGEWVSLGGSSVGGGTGDGAFLYEGFEGGTDLISETGTWVPDYDEAINVVSEDARVGDECLRLHMEYDWEYPNVSGMPAVKPIPNNPAWSALHDRDPPWGVWGVPFWHGFSLGLPDYWQPDSMVEQVFEFHRDTSDGMDPAADYGTGKPVSCRITGNEMVFLNEWTEGTSVRRVWSDPVTVSAGNWYDIVMNIEWSNQDQSNIGFMDIWVNGEQVMNYVGDTAAADTAHPRPPEYRIYKWEWGYNSPDQQTRTYYFDEMRYADGDASYEDVVPGKR